MFQSPSLRGSGRFSPARRRGAGFRRCFNPLHCGAVVASRRRGGARRDPEEDVSIPFIAGQWSLQPRPPKGGGVSEVFQSPSLRGSGRFGLTSPEHGWVYFVSIPFIAGQWSLQGGAMTLSHPFLLFQSPSLRGSGRFKKTDPPRRTAGEFVSIPFIAGQWSLHERNAPARKRTRVSIPFIAGQWSLLATHLPPSRVGGGFQSPSLRGSGRFGWTPPPSAEWRTFQSPSLRGSGRFWRSHDHCQCQRSGFNPLHCGAVVASFLRCI